MDDDPLAVEKKIDAASDHGINVFIYDWYWYGGEPFLEEALNEGFLKARNNLDMQFYIMWANHDVPGNMWNPYRYQTDTLILSGKVDWDNYRVMVERVIRQYLGRPNYFKINGEPVFSIYDLRLFIESFNGLEGAREALDYFREEVASAGFPGLHIQVVGKYDRADPVNPVFFNDPSPEEPGIDDVLSMLDINSVTMYNMAPRGGIQDYLTYGQRAIKLRNNWDSILEIPFFPVVSVGWDNTPRYPDMGKESVIHINSTPESFAACLEKAREYVEDHPEQPGLLIINAWNEWVEGSYLEPDMLWGYGYLKAVEKVLSGQYDPYSSE